MIEWQGMAGWTPEWILEWLVFIGCLLLHWKALHLGFVGDDLEVLKVTEEAKREPPRILRRLWLQFVGGAYWVKYVHEAHAIALAIHLAVCCMVAWLWGPLAGAIFAIHPATQEVSCWLSAKAYGMTALVVLIAWAWPVLAIPLFVLCPWEFFYFTGLFAPLMFLWRAWPWNLAVLSMTWLLYKHLRFILNTKRNVKANIYSENKHARAITFTKAIVYTKFLGYAFVNGVVCLKSCYYHSYMEDYIDTEVGIKRSKRPDGYLLVGAMVLFSLAAGIIYGPHTQVLFGLMWFVITVSMWCNLVSSGQQHIANRYYYLPYIGIAIMLSTLPVWIVYIIIGLNAREFHYNMRQYLNGYWHLSWQCYNEPWFYYSWILMGCLSFARGNFAGAISEWEQSLVCRPENFKALFNISSGYIARGDFRKAYEYIQRARKADVYGQEQTSRNALGERMRLLTYILKNKDIISGKAKLKISDIPTVL